MPHMPCLERGEHALSVRRFRRIIDKSLSIGGKLFRIIKSIFSDNFSFGPGPRSGGAHSVTVLCPRWLLCPDRAVDVNSHGPMVAQLEAGVATLWSRFGAELKDIARCWIAQGDSVYTVFTAHVASAPYRQARLLCYSNATSSTAVSSSSKLRIWQRRLQRQFSPSLMPYCDYHAGGNMCPSPCL